MSELESERGVVSGTGSGGSVQEWVSTVQAWTTKWSLRPWLISLVNCCHISCSLVLLVQVQQNWFRTVWIFLSTPSTLLVPVFLRTFSRSISSEYFFLLPSLFLSQVSVQLLIFFNSFSGWSVSLAVFNQCPWQCLMCPMSEDTSSGREYLVSDSMRRELGF